MWGLQQTAVTKIEAHRGIEWFLFLHDRAHVNKASSMKTQFATVGGEQHNCPAQILDLNPIEHLSEEIKHT